MVNLRPERRSGNAKREFEFVMSSPQPQSQPKPPATFYTRSERVLLTGVPPENRAHLLRMLRSSDRTVRDMAVLLVFLDRDAQRRTP